MRSGFSQAFSFPHLSLLAQKSSCDRNLRTFHIWCIFRNWFWGSKVSYFWKRPRKFLQTQLWLLFEFKEGRGRDLNPGKRLHRPLGYQATSPRPLFHAWQCLRPLFTVSNLGFCRFIAYTLFLFTEDFSAIMYSPVMYSKPTPRNLKAFSA